MAKKSKKQNIFGFMRMGIFRGAKMPKSGFMLMRIVSIPCMTLSGYGIMDTFWVIIDSVDPKDALSNYI